MYVTTSEAFGRFRGADRARRPIACERQGRDVPPREIRWQVVVALHPQVVEFGRSGGRVGMTPQRYTDARDARRPTTPWSGARLPSRRPTHSANSGASWRATHARRRARSGPTTVNQVVFIPCGAARQGRTRHPIGGIIRPHTICPSWSESLPHNEQRRAIVHVTAHSDIASDTRMLRRAPALGATARLVANKHATSHSASLSPPVHRRQQRAAHRQ